VLKTQQKRNRDFDFESGVLPTSMNILLITNLK